MVEIASVHIVCPHCSTSYAINPATLGEAGRNVRCSRCREVWLATPQDAMRVEPALSQSYQPAADRGAIAGWDASDAPTGHHAPVVDSPSIASDWPIEDGAHEAEADWTSMATEDALDAEMSRQRHLSWFGRLFQRAPRPVTARKPTFRASIACAGVGALVAALLIWRADVVRLLPQTATFYKSVGLNVNLRGLQFRDVKVVTETLEGKPVLLIEGVIVGEWRKAVDLPRLRFSLRDAKGSEIYAWNAVLEQSVLKPGDRVWFKSRLASPPVEGRTIDVRFFNRRDIAGGSIGS
jgi:predicted Zn finger-like uncharacterized protein